MIEALHPNATLERLLATPNLREYVLTSLRAVNDVCKARFDAGARDFYPMAIGSALSDAGVMAYGTYANRTGAIYRELGKAWQDYVDMVDLRLDPNAAPGHPDEVLTRLLADPQRRGNGTAKLRNVYRVCRDRFERGELNFSQAAVGRDGDDAGIVKPGALMGLLRASRGPAHQILEAWQKLADERTALLDGELSDLHPDHGDDGSPDRRTSRAPRFRSSLEGGPEDDPIALFNRMIRERRLTSNIRGVLVRMQAVCEARFESGEFDFGRVASARALFEAKVFSSNQGLTSRLSYAGRYADLLDAWQSKADLRWIDFSPELPPTNPHALFRRLREMPMRGDKLATLTAIHRVCYLEHRAGRLDFDPRSIGKVLEERGIIDSGTVARSGNDLFRTLLKAWDEHSRPWAYGEGAPPPSKRKNRPRANPDFEWVRLNHPEFEEWRLLAKEWVQRAKGGLQVRLDTLNRFFEHVLTRSDVPTDLVSFFKRGTPLPDLVELVSSNSEVKVVRNNHLLDFFQWVLLLKFGEEADDGELLVSPAFRNPIIARAGAPEGGSGRRSQSARSPLPYGYIHSLRRKLALGLTFRDWTLAQQLQGAGVGAIGRPNTSWFEVERDAIDVDDPDCVWRMRTTTTGRLLYEMWSPVRWVALLVKLLIPLRTLQVRTLDSGESDTWKYVSGKWILNDHPLAYKNERKPWRQGVLRRKLEPDGVVATVLFANTNKTADRDREGVSKGYDFPWHASADPLDSVFYWLEKLRNWQSKYNPIKRRTAWSELLSKHIDSKTDGQLRSYADTCFLFRMPEDPVAERAMPLSDSSLSHAWFCLLEAFQDELAEKGEVDAEGLPIVFVGRDDKGRVLFNDFPLHSLRVSLVTAFVLDGGVPFEIMQKLLGHSRLMMTIYYAVIRQARVVDEMSAAAERLDAQKEASVQQFLRETAHDKLVKGAICNNGAALVATIPVNPADRNPAGWMMMHHGLCLVGGNVSAMEDNAKVGGCYNGGADTRTSSKPQYGPVPGGARNCVRCRWFVTEPHYLPALAAHFNNVAYHFDEARNRAVDAEHKWQELMRRKAELEFSGELFTEHRQLANAERLMESTISVFSDRAHDLVATWRLVERCRDALNAEPSNGGIQLVIRGETTQVIAKFEEVDSELLQLSGVCEGAEVYPDLEAGKAVLRRSQLLDSALYNEGLPPMFMRLTEDEQLKVGNAFMRKLSQTANPDSPFIGHREVVKVIDAGKKLSQSLGLELDDLLNDLRLGDVQPVPLKFETVEA